LSLKKMTRGPRPHFENPSAEPQTLLTVSGICVLNLMDCELSVYFTVIDVTEAKYVSGVVVK
jgi:hypothetical protein